MTLDLDELETLAREYVDQELSGGPICSADKIVWLVQRVRHLEQLVGKLERVVEAAKICEYQEKTYGCDDMTFAPVFYQLRKTLADLGDE